MPYADPERAKARCREYHAKHREEANAKRKAAYRAADKATERAKRRAWYDANRGKALNLERERAWRKLYGITGDDYARMLAEQGGGCAICGAKSPGKRARYFAVDHCHVTGTVRGLLCIKCNWRLGWFELHQHLVLNYLMAKAGTVQ